jgi:hypothetical protein
VVATLDLKESIDNPSAVPTQGLPLMVIPRLFVPLWCTFHPFKENSQYKYPKIKYTQKYRYIYSVFIIPTYTYMEGDYSTSFNQISKTDQTSFKLVKPEIKQYCRA